MRAGHCSYARRYRDFAALAKLSSGLKSRLRDWRDGYLSTEVIRSRLEAAKIKLKTISERNAEPATTTRKGEGSGSKGASSSLPTVSEVGSDSPDDASATAPPGERVRKRRRFNQPDEQGAVAKVAVAHADAPAAAVVSEPALPDGWSRAKDAATGQEYYYNKNTLETSWEVPSPVQPKVEPAPEPAVPTRPTLEPAEDSTTKVAAEAQSTDVAVDSATAEILKRLPLSTGDRLMNSFVAYFSDEGGTTPPLTLVCDHR
jgi:hypothetical protein